MPRNKKDQQLGNLMEITCWVTYCCAVISSAGTLYLFGGEVPMPLNRGGASPKQVGGTNQVMKTCKNLDSFKKVWGASLRKFRNFGINLVHSGVYSDGSFVKMGT